MQIKTPTPPYWRLSGFYLFYFATLGALLPYWSLYLQSLGFAPQKIGELMALLMATRVLAPNIWSYIADYSGKRMLIVRMASLLAALAFSAVYLNHDYWTLAGIMVVFSFFWNGTLAQVEVTTLTHLGKKTHHYSRIRLWGSVGFILSVALLGAILDRASIDLLPTVILTLMASIWLVSLTVPESNMNLPRKDCRSLWEVLQKPEVLTFFAAAFLMQASHGPYYTFYTLYMEGYGYSRSLIGYLWALGVIAEVGLFLIMHRLLLTLGVRWMLLGSLLLASLRWLLVGLFPTQFSLMVFAQILHAATFGSFHAAAIDWIHHRFTGAHQGRGQALYSSLGFGAGGAFGSFYSGQLWAVEPRSAYLTAAAIGIAAFCLAYPIINRPPR
ncbi:MFS transporter [Nitrosococcus watsonii]|uniref:Major facilitator superfamily MFS_1 n=1 Tax=Nitrosococcus watsoni (strain C-113) TaxID=105559 RepID=D8K9G6_NITWC|nr:MFS transporter [Nitrosococcus watsonii]ADJ27255.1 major facilitator superfamily MFS_1 [Nitrosococcus watsonii C-113]